MNPLVLTQGVPVEWEGHAQVFTALGDPWRQRILLAFDSGDRLSIQHLAEHLPLSRTAVVHHLNVLRKAGLLRSESVGRETHYRLATDRLRAALEAVHRYLTPTRALNKTNTAQPVRHPGE